MSIVSLGTMIYFSGGEEMTFYERIKELRTDNDKAQKEIAAILKVGQSYYSKQERGEKPFQIEQIIILAKYYQVSADYILGLPKGLSWPR